MHYHLPSRHSLVVELVVAIDQARVRFPVPALIKLFESHQLEQFFFSPKGAGPSSCSSFFPPFYAAVVPNFSFNDLCIFLSLLCVPVRLALFLNYLGIVE
jgi:hypothetical protein